MLFTEVIVTFASLPKSFFILSTNTFSKGNLSRAFRLTSYSFSPLLDELVYNYDFNKSRYIVLLGQHKPVKHL